MLKVFSVLTATIIFAGAVSIARADPGGGGGGDGGGGEASPTGCTGCSFGGTRGPPPGKKKGDKKQTTTTTSPIFAPVVSDIRAKQDIVALGQLENGLRLYRYRYRASDTLFVGVMAQEVAKIRPDAVARAPDGYLRVSYRHLGLQMQTWEQWQASNGALPH